MFIPIENITFIKDQIEKIGNTIIYLAGTIPELNKTKILKILFLLEEGSYKKYGYPFFGIDFQLWKHGPVAKDIFIDLSEDAPALLAPYIQRDEANPALFKAVAAFDDGEFSDNDMELLNDIVAYAKHKSAAALVAHTHSASSLWRQSALRKGVLELLEKELINSTEFIVDFSILFEHDPLYRQWYEEIKENTAFLKQLKS